MRGPAKAFALARLFARVNRPLLVVTYQHEAAQRLWDDLVRFGIPEERVCVLPASQSFFLEGDITDFRVIGERIAALMTLARDEPTIVIGTAEAVLQRTSPPDDLLPYVFTLHAEETIDFDDVVADWYGWATTPSNTVTRPGEFSRRGGILDVFPSTSDDPSASSCSETISNRSGRLMWPRSAAPAATPPLTSLPRANCAFRQRESSPRWRRSSPHFRPEGPPWPRGQPGGHRAADRPYRRRPDEPGAGGLLRRPGAVLPLSRAGAGMRPRLPAPPTA